MTSKGDVNVLVITYKKRSLIQIAVGVLAALLPCLMLAQHALSQPATTIHSTNTDKERTRSQMLSAWYTWDPYQFEKIFEKSGERLLTGLDIQLLRATLARAGIDVSFTYLEWDDHQKALKEGKNDVATGAFITPEREQYAWFSNHYRYEANVLYVKRGMSKQYPFQSAKAMLAYFRTHAFRLGVVQGYSYTPSSLNQYITAPENRPSIVFAKNELALFRHLKNGYIDGFLTDRIIGATLNWRSGFQDSVEEYPGFFAKAPVHLMFSKKTVAKETVDKINQTIDAMKQDGSYKKITKHYLFPVLLNITIGSQWFFALDILGTIAFALSGLTIAFKEHYSIVGALVLAALPAVGGGIMRDLLVSRDPIGVVRTPVYLLLVFGVVVTGYLLITALRKSKKLAQLVSHIKRFFPLSPLQISDAAGLAAFTITGVTVAVEARLTPLWLWAPLLAAITSSGGGILRDIVRSHKHIDSLKGELYPEVSFIWGLLFYFIIEWESSNPNLNEIFIAVLFVLLGAFFTRVVVMLLKWRSLIF